MGPRMRSRGGSMASKSETKTSSKGGEQLSEMEIISKFQQMRGEQRKLVNKLSELESDKNEHRLVIQTLKGAPPDRRCFRMMGGVLIERTVKDLLPLLENNMEQLGKVIETMKVNVEEKGKELNAFREKYNIRFRGEMETEKKPAGGGTGSGTSKDSEQSQGILVS